MNDQKKLKLSKETLRCLDDDALTDVVGGGHGRQHGGGREQLLRLQQLQRLPGLRHLHQRRVQQLRVQRGPLLLEGPATT